MNDEINETTITVNANDEQFVAFSSIEIFHEGRIHKISGDSLPFSVGRDADKCDLAINDNLVSREHFVLKLRDGLLGLEDKSTNGTWVQLGRAEAVQIKNGFLPLVGSGLIQVGCEINSNQQLQMHFKVFQRHVD